MFHYPSQHNNGCNLLGSDTVDQSIIRFVRFLFVPCQGSWHQRQEPGTGWHQCEELGTAAGHSCEELNVEEVGAIKSGPAKTDSVPGTWHRSTTECQCPWHGTVPALPLGSYRRSGRVPLCGEMVEEVGLWSQWGSGRR